MPQVLQIFTESGDLLGIKSVPLPKLPVEPIVTISKRKFVTFVRYRLTFMYKVFMNPLTKHSVHKTK